MQPAAKNLIIADISLAAQDVSNLRQHINERDETLVIARSPKLPALQQLDDLNVTIRSLDDYVSRASSTYNTLFDEARQMVQAWRTTPPFARYAAALEYDGFRLWDMAEYHITLSVFTLLLWIETMRRVLRSNDWQRVAWVGTERYLWDSFQMAAAETGFCGKLLTEDRTENHISATTLPAVLEELFNTYPLSKRLQARPFRPLRVVRLLRAELDDRFKRQQLQQYRRPNAATYLFLVNNRGTTLDTLLPIIQRVRADNQVFLLGYGKRFSSSQLQQHDLNYEWAKYVPPTAWPRLVVGLQRTLTIWNQLVHDTQVPALATYHNISLWSQVGPLLQSIFLDLIPRMMLWIEALKHIFATITPRALIAGTDKTVQVITAAEVARRSGIPSLYVQVALHGDVSLLSPFYTDYGTVIDAFSHQIHVKHSNLPPERFVITGLPRWDTIAQRAAEGKHELDTAVAAIYHQLQLDTTERIVVLATQPFGMPYMERVITAVMRGLAHHPDTRLVLKLHPAEHAYMQLYETLLDSIESQGARPVVVLDIHLHTLLVAADLVIVLASNVGLEAALLDRPVLAVNFTGEPDFFPFVERGIAIGAYSEAEVAQQIAHLLDDPQALADLGERRQTYFRANPQLTDGKATERVANLIRSISSPCP